MICTYVLRHQNGKLCSQIDCKKHKPSLSFPLNDLHRNLNTYDIQTLKSYIQSTYTKPYLITYLGVSHRYKKDVIDSIFELHQRLQKIHHYESSIQTFQQRWRQKHYTFQNTEDPFTLESISEIPSNELFQYIDTNYLYQFRIQEFYHHCNTNGPYNPLNRHPIPESILKKLKERLSNRALKNFNNPWETPTQAFLDVLYLFEKEGFYTKLDWFMNLSTTHVFNLFILLHIFMTEYDLNLFDIYNLDPVLHDHQTDTALLLLATEMKKLVELEHSMKFLFLCSFFLILASVDPRIKRQLPDWIWNTVQT